MEYSKLESIDSMASSSDKFLVSICIPTRNRAAYIGQTLASFGELVGRDIEIVIVDGASTDNTQQVVEEYQDIIPNLSYFKLIKNGGVDADLAKSVSLARGTYCWLMSSDDMAVDGALNLIHEAIRDKMPGVVLFDRIDCRQDMVPIDACKWFPTITEATAWNFSQKASRIEYLKNLKSIGGLFSYIPSIIVRRDLWNKYDSCLEYNGTCYAHVCRFLWILRGGSILKYIPKPIVLCRADNDSFSSFGLVARYRIDFEGYAKILSGMDFSQDELDLYKSVIRREHSFTRLLKLRAHMSSFSEWKTFNRDFLIFFCYSKWTVSLAGLLGSMGPIVRALCKFNDLLRNRLKPFLSE